MKIRSEDQSHKSRNEYVKWRMGQTIGMKPVINQNLRIRIDDFGTLHFRCDLEYSGLSRTFMLHFRCHCFYWVFACVINRMELI